MSFPVRADILVRCGGMLLCVAVGGCLTPAHLKSEVADIKSQVEDVKSAVQISKSNADAAQDAAQAAEEAAVSAQSTANEALASAKASNACCEGINEKTDRMLKRATPETATTGPVRKTVYYATNRNQGDTSKPKRAYGTNRAQLSYGRCEVSIPSTHVEGQIEEPPWWKFWAQENPSEHVILLHVYPSADKASFFDLLREAFPRSAPKRAAFVFIPGFSVSFEDAAKRTAQMAADLKFDGVPIFFSWPSKDHISVRDYLADETSARASESVVTTFLDDFMTQTNAEQVYLIAHSLGTDVLTQAFMKLVAVNPKMRRRVREVILAAPDIDAEIFKNDVAPVLLGSGNARTPLTLYASSTDKALATSHEAHKAPRAGEIGQGLVLLNGVETIDASNVDTSFLNHSPFDSRAVISDISVLIDTGQRACNRFGLEKIIQGPMGVYCSIRP